MIKIFIVDDEEPARDRMRTLLEDIAQECPHQVVGEAGEVYSAMSKIAATTPDVVLLDIQMPSMSGLDLASYITKLLPATKIIFVTAYDEYALRAFDVKAVDYLVKPVRAERLADALQRINVKTDNNENDKKETRKTFSVNEFGRIVRIPVHEVIFLRAEQKYIILQTRENKRYLMEDSLTSIENELSDFFVRIHRKILVAKSAVIGLERAKTGAPQYDEKNAEWEVILRDCDERLPVSRRMFQTVKSLIY